MIGPRSDTPKSVTVAALTLFVAATATFLVYAPAAVALAMTIAAAAIWCRWLEVQAD